MTTTAVTQLASGPISAADLFRARWVARRVQAAAPAAYEPPPMQHGTAGASEALTDVAGRPYDTS